MVGNNLLDFRVHIKLLFSVHTLLTFGITRAVDRVSTNISGRPNAEIRT